MGRLVFVDSGHLNENKYALVVASAALVVRIERLLNAEQLIHFVQLLAVLK
jgi:hypothetical protein